MAMAYFIADVAYVLAVLFNLGAFLLLLEWLVHLLPGAGLNPIRRGLFRISLPLLQWSDGCFAIKWGAFNSRGIFLAALILMVSRYGIPWLILFSFSLRG
jgi:hypothetical protein